MPKKKRLAKELVVKTVNSDGSLDLMTPKESRAWRRKLKTRIKEQG